MVDRWARGGDSWQVIHEAEILPVVISRKVWSEALKDKDIIHFVDQDAARYNLIRGYAGGDTAASLVDDFWMQEAEVGCSTWFERVQTDANTGDPASRGDVDHMRRVGEQTAIGREDEAWIMRTGR